MRKLDDWEYKCKRMQWKIITESYLVALLGFSTYFIVLLRQGYVFQEDGKLRLGVLICNCAVLLLTFAGATLRASIQLENTARQLVISPQEKEALSPRLVMRFSPLSDDPDLTPHKYPLYEYVFRVENSNKGSTAMRDLSITLLFKNRIHHIESETVLDNGVMQISGFRSMEKGTGKTTVTEISPVETIQSRSIHITVRKQRTNGEEMNTNEAVLSCMSWPVGASFNVRVVVDVAETPQLIVFPGMTGKYAGKYRYEIKGHDFEEKVDGTIPDPNVTLHLAEYHYQCGNDCEGEAKLGEAIGEYTKALDLNRGHAKAYFHRGLCYYRMREYAKAIGDYDQLIQVKPTYADAYCNRGTAYAALGRYDEAVHDYSVYIQMEPNDPEGYYGRGLALGRMSRNAEAIADFTTAILINTKYGEAYVKRASVYARQAVGEYDKAILDYQHAMEIDPNRTDKLNPQLAVVHRNRGTNLLEKNCLSEAITDFDRAIELDPRSGESYYCRGVAWQKKGNKKKATEDFRIARRLGDAHAAEKRPGQSGKN